MKKKIMVSSIGSPAGISVIKTINKNKYEVHGLNSSTPHVNVNDVDFFHLVPRISDVNYLKVIKKIVEEHEIDLFVPTIQPDLNIINKIREFVEVLTVNNYLLDVLLDKVETYKKLEKNGLSHIIPMYDKVEKNNYIKLNDTFEKPYIIKPSKEHGGQGFKSIVITDEEKIPSFILKGDLSYRSFRDFDLIMKRSPTKDLIISELLQGPEISVDCLFLKDQEPIIIPRKRIRTSGGIVVEGELFKNYEIISIVKKIGERMNFSNFMNIQFMYDKEKKPKLIDINPRFCGSFIMSYGGGVNFVDLALDDYFDIKINIPKVDWNVKFTRFWSEIFHD